jgi:hypothetical protein
MLQNSRFCKSTQWLGFSIVVSRKMIMSKSHHHVKALAINITEISNSVIEFVRKTPLLTSESPFFCYVSLISSIKVHHELFVTCTSIMIMFNFATPSIHICFKPLKFWIKKNHLSSLSFTFLHNAHKALMCNAKWTNIWPRNQP